MNYHGEKDDVLPASVHDIPSGAYVKFVVQQFNDYKGYHWAEVTRVLVHKDWEYEMETEPEEDEEEQTNILEEDPIEEYKTSQ